MKSIYLAACRAFIPGFDIDYQDIDGTRDIGGSMLDVDLAPYDCILASPPCNFYSRANYRRYVSSYSLATRNLLPDTLVKLALTGKPFIVENVRSPTLFASYGIYDICSKYGIFVKVYGRHTYFTNTFFNPNGLPQRPDNVQNCRRLVSGNCFDGQYREGGYNVQVVFVAFLKFCLNNFYGGK